MNEDNNDCLVCPITFTLFSDPVVAEDGHTYERNAITDWIQRNGTSPLTREVITIASLRPNYIVRRLVEEFRKDLSKYKFKFKLGVDIERSQRPFFQTTGKALYKAKWIGKPTGPSIVLLKLNGARAVKEASFYEHLTRHPNIIYTYGLVDHPQQQSSSGSKTSLMLLQEMAPEGSLTDFLENHSEDLLAENLLNEIFFQITDAMVYLAYNNIIHGDLACRNVLVFRIDEQEPKKSLVKLTDFGISRGNPIYSKIDAVSTMIDTVPIRSSAPEVLQSNSVYSEKSDMYAMGVLMWEAFSNGQIPWNEIDKEAIIKEKVINGEHLLRPMNVKSDHLWKLMLDCMAQKPEDRPTFSDLKRRLTEFLVPKNNSDIMQEKSSHHDMHNLSQNKTGEQAPTLTEEQLKPNEHMKVSSSTTSKIQRPPPSEELIKFTKWH